MTTVFCNDSSGYCLYRVAYTTAGGHHAHWDFWAKDREHAIQSANELLPIGSSINSVNLKEEW